jgi:Zn-dependent protease
MRQGGVFSGIEVRDIVIAWLALGAAFALSYGSRTSLFGSGGLDLSKMGFYFVVAILTVGPGFVFHELSHKFVAQRYGFWAEFRMWPMGLMLALLTSLFGLIFAAPGATYISGMNISKEENGVISIAGPLTNTAIAIIFLPLALFSSGFLGFLGATGAYINFFLALFNLIPIGPLDGSKVFRWNLAIWAVTFGTLAITFYYLFWA